MPPEDRLLRLRRGCALPHSHALGTRQGQRQLPRGANQEALVAGLSPRDQLHLGKGNPEGPGQESAQGPVGLAFHRRCLDPDPIVIPLGLHKLVPAPPRLHPQM